MNDITKTDRFKVMLREAEAFVCSPRTYATDEDKHIAQFVAKFALNILDLKEQLLAKAAAEGIPQSDGWVDVADRLPAQSDLSGYLNDSVFTWSAVGGDDGWASVGRFDIERQKFIGDGYVIAWMPIPEFSKR